MQDSEKKKKLTKSITELGRRVTSADVSAKTGLPVLQVSQLLNKIAAETGGHLAVSSSGDIVYSFSPGFANVYIAQGLRRVIEQASQRALEIGFFVLRISFGVMLILSTIIVVLTIYVLFFAQKEKRRSGTQLQFNVFDYIMIRDLVYLFNTSPAQITYDYRQPTVRKRSRANFLLDCFSFLFGDGNPNEGLAEKQWQIIAQVIKQHNNVVTAEQLAPYTGADPKNEDAVLPVLVRFDGKPEVTESGNIVYTFPSLAISAGNDHTERVAPFLQEFHWKFSELDSAALRPIHMVAAINFAGAWLLWMLLHNASSSATASLYNLLAFYGTMFLLIPLIRWFSIGFLNKQIDKRNAKRASSAEELLSPDVLLKTKIAESREYRLRDKRISQSSIVYSTDKDKLEQEIESKMQFKPGDIIDAKPEETFDASPIE